MIQDWQHSKAAPVEFLTKTERLFCVNCTVLSKKARAPAAETENFSVVGHISHGRDNANEAKWIGIPGFLSQKFFMVEAYQYLPVVKV